MSIELELFKKAYKKLKSNVYFDKTSLPLRNHIVEFESNQNIETSLKELHRRFNDSQERSLLFEEILSSISFNAYPKGIKKVEVDDNIINNFSAKRVDLDKLQYFINLDVKGHILGVLWIMLIGYRLDKGIYEKSYGNRIKNTLHNEFSGQISYSPYLFKPYFRQYESWRDSAMDKAQQILSENQDVLIFTMDFERFFYSLDISKEFVNNLYEQVREKNDPSDCSELNEFIYKVIERYSKLFGDEFDKRRILPIGFLPSNIISNCTLSNFDKAITDLWNPSFYGRYVDDLIIVDKVKSNGGLCRMLRNNAIGKSDLIKSFFVECPYCDNKKQALFENIRDDLLLNNFYKPLGNENDHSAIKINESKGSVFYFKSGENEALLNCFRDNIAKNKSEFRRMPEDEAVFQKDDYSQIYNLKYNSTINKLGGVTGLEIDKYNLSKLLGKYLRVGGLVNDRKEYGFVREIDSIFDTNVIIDNYSTWEKVIHILYINGFNKKLVEFIQAVINAIEYIHLPKSNEYSRVDKVKATLREHLLASVGRAVALIWGDAQKEFIEELGIIDSELFAEKSVYALACKYYKTRMIDKSLMPLLQEVLTDVTNIKNKTINLTKFFDVIDLCKRNIEDKYLYYPYIISSYDLSMMQAVIEMLYRKSPFEKLDKVISRQSQYYADLNYNYKSTGGTGKIKPKKWKVKGEHSVSVYEIEIDGKAYDKLKVGVANVKLSNVQFIDIVKNTPNRSYERYLDISKVINLAIDENVDLLVMPESYVPFEWLPTIARTCEKNGFAVVTGVEHLKVGNKIFNLTAVILPYEDEYNPNALVSFHLKTNYAPSEKELITGYGLTPVEGKCYELYKWKGNYFPVYCCFELTSINDRALFQAYADFIIAIEWNKDVEYYSNIIGSLSRDMHCYCIQVNCSEYGDSRITKPSRSVEKDIIKVKGGDNSVVLVGTIDIEKLRMFQLKNYTLQRKDNNFKPTPAGFNAEIVKKKMKLL